jgi:hypothetical protein
MHLHSWYPEALPATPQLMHTSSCSSLFADIHRSYYHHYMSASMLMAHVCTFVRLYSVLYLTLSCSYFLTPSILCLLAVDCVGQYTSGVCTGGCGLGAQQRTYEVTTTAENGGTACPLANGSTTTGSCVNVCPNNVKLSLGAYHSCAVLVNTSVACWGVSFARNVPVGTSNVVSLTALDRVTFALRSDGSIIGWGDAWNSTFSNFPATGLSSSWQAEVAGLNASAVAAWTVPNNGNQQVCIVLTNNSLKCISRPLGALAEPPAAVQGRAVDVCVGNYYGCALLTDATVTCWGGSFNLKSPPPAAANVNVVSVVCGRGHACILNATGTVSCWGAGADVNNTAIIVPQDLGTGVKQISANIGQHTCALKSDSTVACWGYDYYLQVSGIPQGLTDVVHVAAGSTHSCATKSDGKVVCWGQNADAKFTPPVELQ